ncbi:unnamed protein product [Peronospora belbahrii]|uniref:Uncharacterized protein n=1 Tax=Peronospora belbahrii TaxID=622444 RepID=A0AAU9L580_9STRA|nr:unnamed protein product [Peronospora belbahrii]CAH0517239.1 unnamed protein product [Peronospora belbahrii]
MERKDRKRKALESFLVSERITELTSELKKNDAALREEIQELHDEVNSLKKDLESKSEESARFQAEAEFLHPDAVVDRVRTKLWHHGDLSLLRKAIDPRTRVLRVTESRSDRSLYICDTTPKKAGSKAHLNDSKVHEFSPKHECEDTLPMVTKITEPVEDSNYAVEALESNAMDCGDVSSVSKDIVQTKPWPSQDMAETQVVLQQDSRIQDTMQKDVLKVI